MKIIFQLNERIYDKSLYKTFYKIFAIRFCQYYKIEQFVDTATCDITRVCFLSHDPNIYFNPKASLVSLKKYINTENTTSYNDVIQEIKQYEQKSQPTKIEHSTFPLTDDILLKIKHTLNPQYRPPKPNPVVPETLNKLIPDIIQYIEQTGLKVEEVTNIQYGKKIRISHGYRWAELNIFYGKKGFSIVKTPKNGSDSELSNIVYEYLRQFLEI